MALDFERYLVLWKNLGGLLNFLYAEFTCDESGDWSSRLNLGVNAPNFLSFKNDLI